MSICAKVALNVVYLGSTAARPAATTQHHDACILYHMTAAQRHGGWVHNMPQETIRQKRATTHPDCSTKHHMLAHLSGGGSRKGAISSADSTPPSRWMWAPSARQRRSCTQHNKHARTHFTKVPSYLAHSDCIQAACKSFAVSNTRHPCVPAHVNLCPCCCCEQHTTLSNTTGEQHTALSITTGWHTYRLK